MRRSSSLYGPRYVCWASHWDWLPQPAPLLGLGLAPFVSPISDWDCVPIGQNMSTTTNWASAL